MKSLNLMLRRYLEYLRYVWKALVGGVFKIVVFCSNHNSGGCVCVEMETHYIPLSLEWGNIDQIHWDDKNLIPIVSTTVDHVVLHTQVPSPA